MEDVTAATARRAEGFTFRSLKTFGTVETAPLLSGCRHHCQIESQNSSITWTPNGVCTNGGRTTSFPCAFVGDVDLLLISLTFV